MLELERGGPGKDLIGRILRLAHTLKGASRVVKQTEIAELAHAIEDVFAPYREQTDAVPVDEVNQALGLLDTIAARVSSLDSDSDLALPVAAATAKISQPAVEEFFETVRVEIAETDKLLDGVSEAFVQLTALRREMCSFERTHRLAGTFRECLCLAPGANGGDAGLSSASLKAHDLVWEP